MLARALGAVLCTVHAAVGTITEHRRMVELLYTLEDLDNIDVTANKPHGVQHRGY